MYSALGHFSSGGAASTATLRAAAATLRAAAATLRAAVATPRAAGCNPMCCRPGDRLGTLLHGAIQEGRAAFRGQCLLYLLWLTMAYYERAPLRGE